MQGLLGGGLSDVAQDVLFDLAHVPFIEDRTHLLRRLLSLFPLPTSLLPYQLPLPHLIISTCLLLYPYFILPSYLYDKGATFLLILTVFLQLFDR